MTVCVLDPDESDRSLRRSLAHDGSRVAVPRRLDESDAVDASDRGTCDESTGTPRARGGLA